MTTQKNHLPLLGSYVDNVDGFRRDVFGPARFQPILVVKRMGRDQTTGLPDRTAELVAELGLPSPVDVTVLGDTGEGSIYWHFKAGGKSYQIVAPFDDEAFKRARWIRRTHGSAAPPPRAITCAGRRGARRRRR